MDRNTHRHREWKFIFFCDDTFRLYICLCGDLPIRHLSVFTASKNIFMWRVMSSSEHVYVCNDIAHYRYLVVFTYSKYIFVWPPQPAKSHYGHAETSRRPDQPVAFSPFESPAVSPPTPSTYKWCTHFLKRCILFMSTSLKSRWKCPWQKGTGEQTDQQVQFSLFESPAVPPPPLLFLIYTS